MNKVELQQSVKSYGDEAVTKSKNMLAQVANLRNQASEMEAEAHRIEGEARGMQIVLNTLAQEGAEQVPPSDDSAIIEAPQMVAEEQKEG